MMRARMLLLLLLLAASVVATGCQTETRTVGYDPVAAADRAGWDVSNGETAGPAPAADEPLPPSTPARDPSEVVEVPVGAFRPLDRFFDNEGFLLGDRIEIDCSHEPFMARMVALATNARFDQDGEAYKYVVREDSEADGIYTVRLRSLIGSTHQATFVPRATFASLESRERPESAADVRVRPFFEFIGTEEIVIRLHLRPRPDRPVWFRAVATGTPSPLDGRVRACTYLNANRGRKTRGERLELQLRLQQTPDGRWVPQLSEPRPGGDEAAPAGDGGDPR